MLPEGILSILRTEPTFEALEQAIGELAADQRNLGDRASPGEQAES